MSKKVASNDRKGSVNQPLHTNALSGAFGEENCVTTCTPSYEEVCEHNDEFPENVYAPECKNVLVGFDCFEYCWTSPSEPEDPCPWGDCEDECPYGDCDEGPCADCEEPDSDEVEEALDTDCASFNFVKTSLANWQEAGLNKISLRMVWVGDNGITVRNMEVNHLVFGLPTYYTNSATGAITNVSPGQAANIAAQATEYARNMTYTNFRNSPTYPPEATIISYFRNKVNEYMVGHRGTAGTNGSGSSLIQFKNEQRSHYSNPTDC